jgi:hypothetical protein
MEIDRSLRIEPEVRRRSKRGPKLQSHLGCYRRSAVYDAIDDFDIASDVRRQLLLRHGKRGEKFLPQNLAGGGWGSMTVHLWPSS